VGRVNRDGHGERGTQTRVRLELARTLSELEALAGPWQALEPVTPLATLQHAWVVAAVEAYGERRLPHVLLAYRDGELRGIAPLWRSSRRDGRLVLIGSEELAEPMDIIALDDEVRTRLISAMLGARVPLSLQRLPSDGRTARVVRHVADQRTIVVPRSGAGLPWIALGPGWHDPLSQLNSRRRGDLRRAQRRARQMGEPTFEVLAPDPSAVGPLVEEALGTFYRALTRRAAARGNLRVSFFRIDGHAAAMQVGVEFAGRYWTYKIGYDERFQRLSPGVQLMCHTIGWSARRGLQGYELLGESEHWLRLWTTDEHPSETLHCFPMTPRGVRALAVDVSDFGRRRLVEIRAARRRSATMRQPLTGGPVA
jgi:CelD/BcsL family acetyltransferase involved in cellulose biosynthesis